MTMNVLLVLLPVGLLALVSGLCFVGCVLDTTGLPPEFQTYQDTDVLANPNCIAFWPLNEGSGPLAEDTKGKMLNNEHDGTYHSVLNPGSAGQYPCPTFMNGGAKSAACTGQLTLGAANSGIVNGDFVGDAHSTAMQTDGAYVEIAANNVTTPANAFTAEAWISPGWDASDSDAFHTFLDFRSVDAAGAISGFAMLVNDQGQVQGAVGRGAAGQMIATGASITLEATAYVVLTFDGATATVFVNGTPNPAGAASLQAGQNYVPNTTGRQVIGAGAPWAANRTDQTADLFFPAFPFKGTIQDVAIYSAVLSDETILIHNMNGNGQKAG